MRLRVKRLMATSGVLSLFLGVPVWPTGVEAAGVQARFGIDNPSAGPFPSNLFTVPDDSQNTGLRVNLPKPDCAVRVSDCQNINVINTLDGFNLQPRLSIPFSGPIDVNTVTSKTVFLLRLGRLTKGKVIGINQVVWDPETNTLHVESDELLEQHTRYALIVTRKIRDTAGKPVQVSGSFAQFFAGLPFGQTQAPALKAYHKALVEAVVAAVVARVNPLDIVAVSVFTTQSATAVLEKIRDQLEVNTPEPVDFLLGPGGTRTVFKLNNVSSMSLNRQTTTTPTFVPTSLALFLTALRAIPGAVDTIAYGKYVSPNYEATGQVIPPVGTLTGEPAVQGENEIYFDLVLPSGPRPPTGWPVAIFGHGANTSKDIRVFLVAAELAARGIATIGINAVGHGDGPLSTLTVTQTTGGAVTFPSGGRGIDQNGDGNIGTNEGLRAVSPQNFVGINNRDGLQQTVVDLMLLVRVIEVGMDADGDTTPDLDPSRIYYFGQSLGGIYGTIFLAVEPNVNVGVPNVPGGADIEGFRLSPSARPVLGSALAARVPSLINVGGLVFDENIPLRDHPPVINLVAGALEIQQVFEWSEWVTQAGNPVAYAPHLRKAPLVGMLPKDIIVQFVKGDKTVPNPTATALLRAGDLANRATYYRHDLAFPSRPVEPPPLGLGPIKDPHAFLIFNSISPLLASAYGDVGAGARGQIAEFFASDGINVIDPDGIGPLFEVPIVGPLPEELNFIP